MPSFVFCFYFTDYKTLFTTVPTLSFTTDIVSDDVEVEPEELLPFTKMGVLTGLSDGIKASL